MGKLGVFSGKEVCQILRKYGFLEDRRHGSHMIMKKKIPGSTITVSVPDHTDLAAGTLKGIIKQSQVPSFEFEK